MWCFVNDFLRGKMFTTEQILEIRKRKNEGAALLFLGICSIILGICNYMFLEIMYDKRTVYLSVSIGLVVLGIILLPWGIKKGKEKIESIAQVWADRFGYTVEEIVSFTKETRMDSTLAYHEDFWIHSLPKIKVESLSKEQVLEMGFITKNWFKTANYYFQYIVKIEDIAAIWHIARPADKDTYPGISFIKRDGSTGYGPCSEKMGNWLIEEIHKRNPLTITAAQFIHEGKAYDGYEDPGSVAAIYNKALKS